MNTNLQTANQARALWTILAGLVLLCSLEQVFVLSQSGVHAFLPSQSKAYVVAAANHICLFYFSQKLL